MTGILRPAASTVLLFTALLGLAAPAAMTGIAGVVFPDQAGGSLIEREGKVVGSALIGQAFTQPRYFQPRPRPPGMATMPVRVPRPSRADQRQAGGCRERVAAAGPQPVPADAVTASGSGLDPISARRTRRGRCRVSLPRGIPEARVRTLLQQHTDGRQLGLLGEPRVNVLLLNLALDTLR
ncbi:potassium-transporting ATPase subunit C [Pseudoroseomonas wenyumeiae]